MIVMRRDDAQYLGLHGERFVLLVIEWFEFNRWRRSCYKEVTFNCHSASILNTDVIDRVAR